MVHQFTEETMSEETSNPPQIFRIQESQLGTTHSRVTTAVNKFRRCLEDAVIKKHGEISVASAAAINTAARAEKAARVMGTLLRRHAKELDPMKQAELQEKIVKLSERRDSAIARLKIESEKKKGPNWGVVDAKVVGDE